MRRIMFFAAIAGLSGAAQASDKPLYQPAPDWVKPAPPLDATKLADDAPIYLLLDNQQRLQDGEVWTYSDSATRAASNQVLGQIGTIKLPWQPDDGDLIIHRAEIVRGAEHIDLLKGGERFSVLHREEQLEQLSLDGMLTATMAVEGLRVGDVLRLSYSIRQKDPTLKGNVQTFAPLVSEPFRVQYARDRLLWPDGTDLHWKAAADGVKPELSDVGGYHDLTILMPLAKQPEIPGDAPMRFHNPGVLEATTFDSWAAISKVMAPLYGTDGLIAPGSPLAGEVATIEKAQNDPLQRAAMALALVQGKVRYLFRGMQNGNYVPQKPADTWMRRYGDCKAKTLLLLSMLHAMGIEAEAVLASSQLGDLVPSRLPTPGAFDHVLVHATIGGKSLFLDGTGSGSLFADIGDTPPFRHVLPVRAAGAALLDVPMRASARPDLATTLELDETAGINFPAPFKASFTMRGQTAELLRTAAAQAGKDDLDKMAGSMVDNMVGTATVIAHDLRFDDKAGTATVTASGLAYPNWSREDERYRLTLDKIVSSITFDPDRARPAWKDIPVSTGNPGHVVTTTRIRLPAGGKGFTLAGDEKLDTTIAGSAINRQTSIDGDWVTITEDLSATGAEVAPGDIAATRQQVALAKTRLLRTEAPADYPAAWAQVDAAKKAHAFDAILAGYKAGIAAKPDKSESYTNRAWFFDSIYERQQAIGDLTKAIEIEPTVDAYLWRARLLRDLGDKEKAIADVRAAQKLDPGSAPVLGQLASLESDSGDKDAAIAIVQERIDAGGKDKPDFLSMKADLLAKAGDKDAAMTAIDTAIAASPGNPNLLNSRCWIKGTLNVALDTALKDCTKSIELADSPAAALDSRAMVYFRMNRMDDALADLDAALDISPSESGSMFMRGVIRKRTGDAKAAEADLAAARMISPQIDETYGKYGIKP